MSAWAPPSLGKAAVKTNCPLPVYNRPVFLNLPPMELSAEAFKAELAEALQNYNKYVICLDKPIQDCEDSLRRLMKKAVKAYINRSPGLRHGIALDRQITIILSQTESDTPLCGIYFNLHSPYRKKS